MRNKKLHWVKEGLIWGYLTFILTEIFNYFVFKTEISVRTLMIGVVIWTLGGLVFGYFMKFMRDKKWVREENT